MGIREAVQDGIKQAMREKDPLRLETLRMAKGALLLREKEQAKGTVLSEAESTAALRGEVKKRQQSVEQFEALGKAEEAARVRQEIAVIEEFLPQQLDAAALEGKAKAYLDAHPDVTHAGKLTGALKKELGDLADGKVLAEVCKKVLG